MKANGEKKSAKLESNCRWAWQSCVDSLPKMKKKMRSRKQEQKLNIILQSFYFFWLIYIPKLVNTNCLICFQKWHKKQFLSKTKKLKTLTSVFHTR
jgi:hypothetical protein